MVWSQKRANFNQDLEVIRKESLLTYDKIQQERARALQSQRFMATPQRTTPIQRDQVAENYQRARKVQLALHGQDFLKSVEELEHIVSENYRASFNSSFWSELVDAARLAMKEAPSAEELSIFDAHVTYLVETLRKYPVSNAVTGTLNTLGGICMTGSGFVVGFTGFCLALASGCLGGVILGLGIAVLGVLVCAIGAEQTSENFRFIFGMQISEIEAFAKAVDPQRTPAPMTPVPQSSLYPPVTQYAFYRPGPSVSSVPTYEPHSDTVYPYSPFTPNAPTYQ